MTYQRSFTNVFTEVELLVTNFQLPLFWDQFVGLCWGKEFYLGWEHYYNRQPKVLSMIFYNNFKSIEVQYLYPSTGWDTTRTVIQVPHWWWVMAVIPHECVAQGSKGGRFTFIDARNCRGKGSNFSHIKNLVSLTLKLRCGLWFEPRVLL